MYATGNKKMLNMLILDILKEYSDADHRLTQQEIIRLLKSNYDMECDRRSVKNNILYLKELGYEISMDDGYYLAEREFEDAELRMLIDSVLFSKQLTQKQAKVLIEKLRRQGNRYFSAKVSHIRNLPDLRYADNKQMMYVLDAVNDAIAKKRKISFIYNSYGIDFKLHPKREAAYIVNPYQIVANNSHFYLIGNYDKYDNVSHYRLDRMTCVIILDEKAKPQKEVKDFANGFNLPRHMAEHIYMFSGPSVPVKLRTDESMMNELVDWLGKDFRIKKLDADGTIEVALYCNENAMFYWALQYGPYVEIMEPEGLRERMKRAAQDMNKKYSQEGNSYE
jgi:predicted DNA-binding transcriptional regulator YafY